MKGHDWRDFGERLWGCPKCETLVLDRECPRSDMRVRLSDMADGLYTCEEKSVHRTMSE